MGSPVRGTRIVDLRRRAERLRESGCSRRGVAFAGTLLAARVLRAKRLPAKDLLEFVLSETG